jgi:putative membrane protein
MMGWMPFGGGWAILLWVVIIGLIVWGVTALTRRSNTRHDTGARSALDIARERYARGEISGDEFAQIERDLS